MCYDMRWENGDYDREPFKHASAEFHAACKVRDADPEFQAITDWRVKDEHPLQQAVNAAYRRMGALELDYFRLNIGGMRVAWDELAPVGVIVPFDHKPFPTPPDGFYDRWPDGLQYGSIGFHYTGYVQGADDPFPTVVVPADDITVADRDYATTVADVLDGPAPGDYHGIPSYRFSSNDGWLVRPAEIRTGIGWADEHHDGWRNGLSDYIAEFVDWMTVAAGHGGFRVH